MSESVERRLVELLDHPTTSPFGNPIPGLAALRPDADPPAPADPALPLPGQPLSAAAVEGQARAVSIMRIAETLQPDESTMWQLRRIGAVPGGEVSVEIVGGAVRVTSGDGSVELPTSQAAQIVVAPLG